MGLFLCFSFTIVLGLMGSMILPILGNQSPNMNMGLRGLFIGVLAVGYIVLMYHKTIRLVLFPEKNSKDPKDLERSDSVIELLKKLRDETEEVRKKRLRMM